MEGQNNLPIIALECHDRLVRTFFFPILNRPWWKSPEPLGNFPPGVKKLSKPVCRKFPDCKLVHKKTLRVSIGNN